MTILRPRSRMISIRLSEQEYSALRQICVLTGARSVSDFVRDRMKGALRVNHNEQPLLERPSGIEAQMYCLSEKINELVERIALTDARTKS